MAPGNEVPHARKQYPTIRPARFTKRRLCGRRPWRQDQSRQTTPHRGRRHGPFTTILTIAGDSQLVVEEVGALENTNDFLVSLTLNCTLLVEVVGYDPDEDLYLDGEWRIDRAVPVTGVWDTNQYELDNLTIGQIDDLYPQEVLV